jgi:hypothetical protein
MNDHKTLTAIGLAIILLFTGCVAALAQTSYPAGTPVATSTANCTVNGQPVPCDKILGEAGTFLGVGLGLLILFTAIGILAFIFWLFMLIHAISKPIHDKALWIIIILLFNIIGAIVYYFAVKRHFTGAPSAPAATPAN